MPCCQRVRDDLLKIVSEPTQFWQLLAKELDRATIVDRPPFERRNANPGAALIVSVVHRDLLFSPPLLPYLGAAPDSLSLALPWLRENLHLIPPLANCDRRICFARVLMAGESPILFRPLGSRRRSACAVSSVR
jgi:hypothetical protein